VRGNGTCRRRGSVSTTSPSGPGWPGEPGATSAFAARDFGTACRNWGPETIDRPCDVTYSRIHGATDL
jgi:hypothetical protein